MKVIIFGVKALALGNRIRVNLTNATLTAPTGSRCREANTILEEHRDRLLNGKQSAMLHILEHNKTLLQSLQRRNERQED